MPVAMNRAADHLLWCQEVVTKFDAELGGVVDRTFGDQLTASLCRMIFVEVRDSFAWRLLVSQFRFL